MNNFWNSNKVLLIILAVSVLLRIGAALYLGNTIEELPGTADQISYHNLSIRLSQGYGFTFGEYWWPATPAGEQTAHWSYLYTFYLWFIYSIFGANPLIARLIQAVIVGILQPYIAYLIGARIINRTVGLVSAALTAIYIYFVYYAATLMTEPFYITAIMISLYLSILLAQSSKANIENQHNPLVLGLLLGLSMGTAILLRQLFMLFVPFIVLWICWAQWRKEHKIPISSLGTSLLVILALIIPFTIFNYSRFQRFVLLNTNAGFAFFWGNHPIHGTNFIAILPPDGPSYQDLIPREFKSLDEATLDQALLREGIRFVLDDIHRYILLSLNRAKDYFVFWPSADSGLISNASRVFSFGIFLPFMLYGVFIALFKRKWISDISLTSPVTMLLLFALLYTLIHLLTWTLIRYRLPVDAVLLIFAALGITDLAGRVQNHLYKSKNTSNNPKKGYSSP